MVIVRLQEPVVVRWCSKNSDQSTHNQQKHELTAHNPISWIPLANSKFPSYQTAVFIFSPV